MADAARKTGIGIIGDVPWGTHFCHFYRAKEDLLNILVPYFQTGLENNEFCLWATAEPLGAKEAHKAMEKAMPGFAQYVETGQIEIVPHDRWYLQDGLFDSERVIRGWVDKLDRALAAGYSGMRASGNISWLERKDWESFADYEAAINRVIGQRQMVVLCAYWLKSISAADIFEVTGSHTFAVVGRNGDLELVEGALYRKKAEEALRDRENKYRQLIEILNEGVWVIDKDARTTFVNPRMAEMLGYTVEEMVGKHLFAFMDERGVEVAKNRLERRQRGIKEQHDFEFLRKDGTRLYTSLGTSAIIDDKGDYAGAIAGVQDITERRKVEEELRTSEERYRLLVENATEGIAVIQDGEIVFANSLVTEVIGHSEAGHPFRPIIELIHPDDRQMVMERLLGVQGTQDRPSILSFRIIDKEGNERWVETNMAPYTWDGRLAALALVTDISERKRAEEALEQHNRSLATTNALAIELASLPSREISEAFVTKRLAEMTGAAAVWFTEYDLGDRTLVLRHTEMETELLEKVAQLLGKQPNEVRSPVSEDMYSEIVSNVIGKRQTLTEVSFGAIPPSVGTAIQELMGVDHFIGIAYVIEGELYGTSILAMRARRPDPARELLESVAHMVAISLRQRRAEDTLRQSEKKYRFMAENVSDVIWIIDMNLRPTYLSPSITKMTGYSVEETMARGMERGLTPAAIEAVSQIVLAEVARKGEPNSATRLTSVAVEIEHKDGSKIWAESAGTLVRGSDGQPVEIIGILRDITERKKAEEALRASEERNRLLINNAAEGILVLQDEKVVFVNPRYTEIVGFSEEELVSKPFSELVHPDDRQMVTERYLRRLKGEELSPTYTTRTIDKAGNVKWGEAHADLFTWNGRPAILALVTDITDRKRADDTLKASEGKLKALFEILPVGVSVLDAERNLRHMNPALERTVGISPEGLQRGDHRYRRYLRSDGTDMPPEEFASVRAMEEQRAVYDIETGVVTEDGKVVWTSVSAAPVSLSDWSVVVVTTDITERKKAEEALRESEKKFRAIFSNANDGFISVDLESGKFFSANRKMLEMLGYESEEEIENLKVSDIHPEKDLPYILGEFEKHAEGDISRSEDMPVKRKDGSVFFASISSSPLTVANKRYLLCIFRDVTDHKRAEEALRESETRYRTLFDAMPVVIAISTPEGKALSVNNAIKGLSGYTPEEFMAMNISDLFVDPGERKRMLALLQEAGRVSDFEVMFRQKDGLTAHVLLNVDNFELGGQKLIMTTVRDITALKQADIRQRRTHEQLILASRLASLGRLASGVAHEINNPLAVVMGCAQMLMEKDTPEDVKKDLRLINDSAQHMAVVVQRLLTFGRQSKPGKEYVDINALVSRVLGLRAREMSIHNIEVTTRLDPDLPCTMADVGQMQQVFLNIVLNAEQAMTKANKDGHLLVKTGQTGDRITITFRDDGIGIPKEYLPRLFDPFFSTKDVGEGMGLGLSISYGIIKEHNGRIYAKGQPGKGATFVVELPIVAKPDQPESPKKPAEEPKEKVIGRILVVDDEPAICQLLKDLLTRDGHSVETVGDAGVALERLKRERFSLILLDIRMKGMSGIDLYQQMGKIAESLQRRVIFITGDTLARDTRDFLDGAAAPHICKPFDIQQLRKMINRVLWSEG
jgi:PAS domain S-box-containing protein